MTDALYLGDPDEVARAVVGGSLTLSGDEGRHAVTSLAGNALTGEVLSVDAVPTPRWTWRVVQGLAKGDRGDLSVEILTEVGVHHLTAWQSQRSIVKWDAKAAKGLAKWQSTAREAATTPLESLSLPEFGQVTLVVGPKGGIAPAELAMLEANGATPVLISDGVLRASTAGAVALVQLQSLARRQHGGPE